MSISATTPIPKLGEFLRYRRLKYRYTQEEIAQIFCQKGYKVSGATVSRWEMTGAVPGLTDPVRGDVIAKIYGTELRKLWVMAGYVDLLSVANSDQTLDTLPDKLIELLKMATPDQIDLITRVISAIMED